MSSEIDPNPGARTRRLKASTSLMSNGLGVARHSSEISQNRADNAFKGRWRNKTDISRTKTVNPA
jgi:hypothetical protein